MRLPPQSQKRIFLSPKHVAFASSRLISHIQPQSTIVLIFFFQKKIDIFSTVPYKQNRTSCTHLWLASFAKHVFFKIYPCCFSSQSYVPTYLCIILIAQIYYNLFTHSPSIQKCKNMLFSEKEAKFMRSTAGLHIWYMVPVILCLVSQSFRVCMYRLVSAKDSEGPQAILGIPCFAQLSSFQYFLSQILANSIFLNINLSLQLDTNSRNYWGSPSLS